VPGTPLRRGEPAAATGGDRATRPGPRWKILLAVTLGSGIVFLDGTIVNVALETIGRELPATLVGRLEGLTYVTGGYLAVLAALLVLAGALSDRLGRRRVFRAGLLGFAATSVACGLAPTMEVLILSRLAQGAAGAFLVPGALSIISAIYSGAERGRAIGTWAAATAALTTIGPLVGGLLVQSLSWRAAFLVNLPLVAIALWALSAVPESRDPDAPDRFDWLGACVVVLAVGGLAFGATRGDQSGWHDPLAFVALGVGIVALVAFPMLMARRRNPLVPLDLFRRRNFLVVNLATFVIYAAMYVSFTFQALYLMGTLGYSPVAAGLLFIPTGILLATLSTSAGRVAGRVGARPFLVGGPLLMAAGLGWLARIPSTSAPWPADPSAPASLVPPASFLVDVLPASLVFGLGLSLLVAPLTTALMASVPVTRAGLGSAINNAISRVGAPLASAVLFIAISATFVPSLVARVPGVDPSSPQVSALTPLAPPPAGTEQALAAAAHAASTDAFHLAMIVAAAMMVAGAVVSLVGLEREVEAD
jgi:EmrB/QacA subfamily drug resistance transporter